MSANRTRHQAKGIWKEEKRTLWPFLGLCERIGHIEFLVDFPRRVGVDFERAVRAGSVVGNADGIAAADQSESCGRRGLGEGFWGKRAG